MTSAPAGGALPLIERGNCGIGFIADRHGRASHAILRTALDALIHLEHRGALAADATTGDGAGVLTPIPRKLFAREVKRLTGQLVDPDSLGVGVFFFQPGTEAQCRQLLEEACAAFDLRVLCWRAVPVDVAAIGERARATMPVIEQALITNNQSSNSQLERCLYLTRKLFEKQSKSLGAYVPSMSARTIVYKGLFLARQVGKFYADLRNPDYEVPLAVFHQRYSTNTLPTWQRAQPFRVLCHNGEINTLQGNVNWMKSREPILQLPNYQLPITAESNLRPVIDPSGSDSAMLDNAVELLVQGGRDVRHALTMMVPPAWEKLPDLPQDVRDFYEYHTCLTEPWDGPAALVFTDGAIVGAALDRNGLRPNRFTITHDGLIIAGSEAGIVPIEDERVKVKGKLGPGQMIAVDTASGRVLFDGDIKAELATRQPYGEWVRRNVRHLSDLGHLPPVDNKPYFQLTEAGLQTLLQKQAAFGYTNEELVMVLRPMAEDGAEAIGSMGDDTPAAALSEKPRPLFAYFRQRFAEVTNPPIDPLREELVMSLKVRLGARSNFLAETEAQANLLELDSPFLTEDDLDLIKRDPYLKPVTLSTLFPINDGPAGIETTLARICAEAEDAVTNGAQILILSDRNVNARHTFVPSLLALGAAHNYLLARDLRTKVDFIVESGEPREVHHFACLIGYGAAAICPYLALTTVAEMRRPSTAPPKAGGSAQDVTSGHLSSVINYLHAAEHGLLKIMSKMGISTVDAYCGAQIFETLGLSGEVVERFFAGTAHHLSGLGLEDIARIVYTWHESAFTPEGQPTLDSPGFYKFKRSGEVHAFSPQVVHALHAAVKTPGALNGHWEEGYAAYKKYSQLQSDRAPVDPRDLLQFSNYQLPITLDQIEPAQSIVRRFSSAAMSLGALSPEAHETMAIAMNRLGAWSNSGEGGEDPLRYSTEANDRIKQVASARFGVTAHYLISADELQIKMAQGSKPGEGGQLPGHKVTAEIASIRHATPGVTLISPPPHHDIYSIEDLAQLIYDLKQINPRAAVSVKLVAQAGVGTIAAGVAKAGADVILISGNNGGTGASPLSSIKYAGIPWELGLVEAQHSLIVSGMRGRVRLRADGGLRTGRDIVLAALLGADEFSFGTALAIAEGCLMARACHMNTCPVGIATQKPELRAKFDATPEQVMAFILYVAEEVRELLAELGVQSLEEIVGRAELLRARERGSGGEREFDVSVLLSPPGDGPRRYMGEPNPVPTDSPLNAQLLADYLNHQSSVITHQLFYSISNRDRTFGARLAGEIAAQYGDSGLPRGTVDVRLHGSAGQSFGAFIVKGMSLTLNGEANDYVGKGMAGGRIVIQSSVISHRLLVIAGNTCLYGATGGEVFIAGRAGERFGVRNSGADAVVEGLGDHGCEYMTGGTVIVLGGIGYNFGAGMTGGEAYLLHDGLAQPRINPQLVRIESPTTVDLADVRRRVQKHAELTRSPHARALLAEWETVAPRFIKVVPKHNPNAGLISNVPVAQAAETAPVPV